MPFGNPAKVIISLQRSLGYRWLFAETGRVCVRRGNTDSDHEWITLAKLLSLAYLAPDLTDEILNGTQPRQLMRKNIRELDIPLD